MSSQPVKPIILVDGSSYLYRAFHIPNLQRLTNPAGQPTGAIYGVMNMLRSLIREYQPDSLVVVFDAKGKTFRDDLYDEYKANRPSMPDDMRVQLEPLHAIITGLGLPMLIEPNVEADDVIGTLALQASEQGRRTIISTGDKDMAQLVSPHVSLINTMTNTKLDEAGVLEKFGVRPDQIIDFLALVGDSSDNIPGVPSCGPKTAVKWLAAHDTLENVMAEADSVKGKIGEKLRASLPFLPTAKALTTIKTDVPLDKSLNELMISEHDPEALAQLYETQGFRTWSKEIAAGRGSVADIAAPAASNTADESGADASEQSVSSTSVSSDRYETITTMEALHQWIEKLDKAPVFAFDTETTSLDYMMAEVVGVSFAVAEGEAAYVPLAHDYEGAPEQLNRDDVLQALQPLLTRKPCNLVGQHIKYDINVLKNHDIHLTNVAHDTMLQSYVLDSTATRHDMDSLAKKYLGASTIKFEDIAGKGKKQLTFNEIPVDVAATYAAEDADITLRLHHVLWEKLQAFPALVKLYQELEIPLLHVLGTIERQGVSIDVGMLAAQSKEVAATLEDVIAAAYEDAGKEFNLGSPKQIQTIFFEEKQFPIIRKTPKGAPSTAEDVLEQLAHDYELPRLILKHRSLSKLLSTYIDKLPGQVNAKTHRVHTSYHQAVASTGRLSSTDPNLQNIPIRTKEGRRIREAFVPAKGMRLLAADYSQIELRIMAHLSGDPSLNDAFAKGLDVHRATAGEVFGVPVDQVENDQRRAAKAINFGLIYGMSAFGLAKQLEIPRGEAQDYINLYFERYPGVRDYMDSTREKAREDGYVETVFGRRLYLPDINARNAQMRNYAERIAINAPMQGTAADIIKRAMLTVNDWLESESVPARVIMQVHDELVLEVQSGELDTVGESIKSLMVDAASLSVPLEVDVGVGNSWEEAH